MICCLLAENLAREIHNCILITNLVMTMHKRNLLEEENRCDLYIVQ